MMTSTRRLTFVLCASGAFVSSSAAAQRSRPDPTLTRAESLITEAALWPPIRALSDDSMLGRAPGTRGDTLTVRYLEAQFRAAGLAPAGAYGYRQPVGLRRLTASGTLAIRTPTGPSVASTDQFLIRGKREGRTALAAARVVFAGHGIVAPEFGWDDYKNVDVRGSVVILLNGEPAALAARTFGRSGAGTYHGIGNDRQLRYAAARGAAATAVRRGFGGINGPHNNRWRWEQSYQIGDDDPDAQPPIAMRVTDSVLAQLARASGTTLAAWQAAAERPDFVPQRLPVTLDVAVNVQATPFVSHNVVGIVRGSDRMLAKECVVFSTHWDGYGVGPAYLRPDGSRDSIYNAAGDNAGGISELLAQAKAASSLRPAPRRTLVFIASTAEEGGLMGAHAYAAHPVCPMRRTVLAIGMDVFAAYGATGQVTDEGHGYTSLDSTFARLAAERGLRVVPPTGAANMYAGSDHHALALRGVPAVFAGMSGVPADMTQQAVDSIDALHPIHTPLDEIDASWRLAGAVQEARLLFALGVTVANGAQRPHWTVDSEFRRAAQRRELAAGARR